MASVAADFSRLEKMQDGPLKTLMSDMGRFVERRNARLAKGLPDNWPCIFIAVIVFPAGKRRQEY